MKTNLNYTVSLAPDRVKAIESEMVKLHNDLTTLNNLKLVAAVESTATVDSEMQVIFAKLGALSAELQA